MKLLVTGGAGFIGSNFIRYWLQKYPKDKIVNLDKLTYAGRLETTKDFSKNRNYSFVKGDISNLKLAKEVMKGPPRAITTGQFRTRGFLSVLMYWERKFY